jgi:hypothetical protein
VARNQLAAPPLRGVIVINVVRTFVSVLEDEIVRALIIQAWWESQPGMDDAVEQGGFVLKSVDGSLTVERWPQGAQNQIVVPAHPGGKRGESSIVATFHTHPNPGPEFLQEPSPTDIRAVRDDPDLRHADYEGEYVMSSQQIYRIDKSGRVELVGELKAVLKMS